MAILINGKLLAKIKASGKERARIRSLAKARYRVEFGCNGVLTDLTSEQMNMLVKSLEENFPDEKEPRVFDSRTGKQIR